MITHPASQSPVEGKHYTMTAPPATHILPANCNITVIGRAFPKCHELKCHPQYFQAVVEGRKRYEVRKGDRDFRVGDFVLLHEWSPVLEVYTGRWSMHRIPYMTEGEYAVPGIAIFGLSSELSHCIAYVAGHEPPKATQDKIKEHEGH